MCTWYVAGTVFSRGAHIEQCRRFPAQLRSTQLFWLDG
jgi:hypothetical protein